MSPGVSPKFAPKRLAVSAVDFCDQNSFALCIYVSFIQATLSSSFFPLRFLLSRSRPLFDFSSLEASPYGFPVREGGLRRGSPNRSGKLDEITIIIRSTGSTMLRRVTPLLLASLPSSSECFLPFSFSSISLATCFRIRRNLR